MFTGPPPKFHGTRDILTIVRITGFPLMNRCVNRTSGPFAYALGLDADPGHAANENGATAPGRNPKRLKPDPVFSDARWSRPAFRDDQS